MHTILLASLRPWFASVCATGLASVPIRCGRPAGSDLLCDVTGRHLVKWFRPKTDVVLAENRYGFDRKQMWLRSKTIRAKPFRHGETPLLPGMSAAKDGHTAAQKS